MVGFHLHVVKLGGIEILELSEHVLPLVLGGPFLVGVLRWHVLEEIIQHRYPVLRVENIDVFVHTSRRCEERGVESLVVASNSDAVDDVPVHELEEIVLELFTEPVLGQLVLDVGVFAVLLVEVIRLGERNPILTLEGVVDRLDEVVEHIGVQHHLDRPVSAVVVPPHPLERVKTVSRDMAELKGDLPHDVEISLWLKTVTRRLHIDQTSDDARLRVRDLHRPVSAHE